DAQIVAQQPRVFERAVGLFFRVERYEDLAVGRSDGGDVDECQVDAAGGEADVVQKLGNLDGWNDVADLGLDLREDSLSLFDASAFGGADVESHLAGIDIWEEVAADHQGKQQRGAHE